MSQSEKRKFVRLDSQNLFDYTLIGENGTPLENALGRTLDLSINGATIETIHEIPSCARLHLTLGIQEDLILISGHTVHTEQYQDRHIHGIEFDRIPVDDRRILTRFLNTTLDQKQYHEQLCKGSLDNISLSLKSS